MEQRLFITKLDYKRLMRFIEDATYGEMEPDKSFLLLQTELSRAMIVNSEELPCDVVSMHSRILLVLDGKEMELSLVYPDEVNRKEGMISILSPIGTAIIGYHEGDIISWSTPGGLKQIEIRKILNQPEANGEYEL